jgi:hypothetical protein
MHLHEILETALKPFDGRSIEILETGTIRGPTERSKIGDGWSTLFFAERSKHVGGSLISIDLDVSVARDVLRGYDVYEKVELVEGHSIRRLTELVRRGFQADVVLLDSDNDAMLTLHEFMIVQSLVRPGGIVMIDDVRTPDQPPAAVKGNLVWPYIKGLGWECTTMTRHGWNGYVTNVLIAKAPT